MTAPTPFTHPLHSLLDLQFILQQPRLGAVARLTKSVSRGIFTGTVSYEDYIVDRRIKLGVRRSEQPQYSWPIMAIELGNLAISGVEFQRIGTRNCSIDQLMKVLALMNIEAHRIFPLILSHDPDQTYKNIPKYLSQARYRRMRREELSANIQYMESLPFRRGFTTVDKVQDAMVELIRMKNVRMSINRQFLPKTQSALLKHAITPRIPWDSVTKMITHMAEHTGETKESLLIQLFNLADGKHIHYSYRPQRGAEDYELYFPEGFNNSNNYPLLDRMVHR